MICGYVIPLQNTIYVTIWVTKALHKFHEAEERTPKNYHKFAAAAEFVHYHVKYHELRFEDE